jgi:hypothetical protein
LYFSLAFSLINQDPGCKQGLDSVDFAGGTRRVESPGVISQLVSEDKVVCRQQLEEIPPTEMRAGSIRPLYTLPTGLNAPDETRYLEGICALAFEARTCKKEQFPTSKH